MSVGKAHKLVIMLAMPITRLDVVGFLIFKESRPLHQRVRDERFEFVQSV